LLKPARAARRQEERGKVGDGSKAEKLQRLTMAPPWRTIKGDPIYAAVPLEGPVEEGPKVGLLGDRAPQAEASELLGQSLGLARGGHQRHSLALSGEFPTSYLVLDLFLPLSDPSARVPTDAVILVVWVLVPLLMILLASWLTGRFIAGWYARRISQT
jgi:hypothetical protein